MYYMHSGQPYGFHSNIIIGWISLVIFWLFIALLIAIFVKMLLGEKGIYKYSEKSPLDILKERYARGEIEKKEYEEKKKDLKD